MIDTAGAYLELNLYAEALAAYQKAHALLRQTGMVHDRARALWGIGSTLIARSGSKKPRPHWPQLQNFLRWPTMRRCSRG